MESGCPRMGAESAVSRARIGPSTPTSSPVTPAVRLSGVTKTFGSHTAVQDLSIEVPRGALYGFIGPNGSGKTTTIRMILHILAPDEGRIEVLGQQGTRAANDRVGYLPEERGLYKKMTVRRLLTYYASLKGMGGRAAKREMDAWLERFELTDWIDKKTEALSKGMSQKVQFIATVISKPELIILDEPFSGLDPVNLEVLRKAILDLNASGSTVIFSTHDMTVAEQMCDQLFMIFRGKKVLDGTLEEIQAQYGQDTLRVRTDGGVRALEEIDGVEQVLDLGRVQEVRFAGDPQDLLRALCERTRVHHFEEARPTLHDIFIRIAGPDARADLQAGPGTREALLR
ncbi:MAG TPA: ATP-binding cassette domain-containing protein [Planctomycetes bacterium]|nr:ATP-binding cassette domain-containing protein [Planctomycetota bacterium]